MKPVGGVESFGNSPCLFLELSVIYRGFPICGNSKFILNIIWGGGTKLDSLEHKNIILIWESPSSMSVV